MNLLACLVACCIAVPPTTDDVSRWVVELGDSRYAVRENALKQLWEAGQAAESAVRKAATSADPEVSRRARQLVEKYDWGIFPDTAPAVVAAIGEFRGGDASGRLKAIRTLVDLGQPGYVTLGRLANAPEAVDQRIIIGEAMATVVQDVLPKHIRAGNLAAAEELLDACLFSDSAAIIDHYVAVIMFSGRLVPARTLWDERLKQGRPRAMEVSFALARAAGDWVAARKIGEAASRPDLVEQVLWNTSDWRALASRPLPTGNDRVQSPANDLSITALLQRLSGDSEGLTQSLDRLRKIDGGADAAGERFVAAHGLIVNEQIVEALPLLKKLDLRSELHTLLFARADFAEAMAIVDPKPDEVMVDLRAEIRSKTACSLAQLGRTEQATKLFDTITQDAVKPIDFERITVSLTYEKSVGMNELAHAHAARYLDAVAGHIIPEINDPTPRVMAVFLPGRGAEAAIWWRFLRQRDAQEATSARLTHVLKMLGTTDVLPISQELAAAFMAAAPSESPAELVKWMHALAYAHKCAGQDELARAMYRRAIERLDNDANRLKLADFERSRHHFVEAVEAYQNALEKTQTRPLTMYLQARCLAQAGRTDEAKSVGELAFRITVGQFAERAALAIELEQLGLIAEARRERDFVLQAVGCRDYLASDLLQLQAREAAAQHDYARAANLYEQCLVGYLRFADIELPRNQSLVRNARLNRARASLASGKADDAIAHAKACLAMQPNDVSVPIHLAAGLAKLGRQADADDLYHRVADLHRKRLKEFPDSAFLLNNLAWCAAGCHRDLDEALRHATRATQLQSQQPGYFDTLAEVHHQRSEQAAALVAIRKAIALDPTNTYYHSQVRRIEARDRASLPAEPEE